jgi:ketosteroid isomerase-like protein
MKRQALVWAVAGLLLGCGSEETGSPLPVSQPPSSGDPAQIELWKLDLMLEDRASNHQLRASGPSSLSTFFAQDGVWIRPGVGEIQGRNAIHDAFMEDIYSNTLADLTWNPLRAEVSRTGDLGYTVGEYLAVLVDSDGVRTRVGGMYVRVWALQADGTWKVEMEVRNPVTGPEVLDDSTSGVVPENRDP